VKPKWRATIALLLVPIITLVTVGVNSRAQLQEPGGVIQPEVLAALQSAPDVAVIIHLTSPPLPPPGKVTVSVVQAETASRQTAILADLTSTDFDLTYQYSVMPALAGRITMSGVQKLDGRPDVLMVSLDGQAFVSLAESAPLVRAPEVHVQGVTGAGVNIAVLDSGIDTDHVDLANNIVGQRCWLGAFCPAPPNVAEDDVGHGTHVSGIITSNGTTAPLGIAPNAGIFAHKVCTPAGCPFSAIGAAVDFIMQDTLVRNGDGLPPLTPLVNMSLGDRGSYTAGTCRTDQPTIDATLGNLHVFGVLSFAASGNEAYTSGISWPACSPAVVSVGAVYDADVGSIGFSACSDPSTVADKVTCFSNSSVDLDLLGPGAVIRSALLGGTAGELSGTSMSSPHAAAVAALLKQAIPSNTPDQIELALKGSGKWVKDARNNLWTPRIDARVALLTDIAADYDLDGCTNGGEFGPNPGAGGQRNPLDPYDFYDINHDGAVTIAADIYAVAQSFGVPARYIDHKDRGLTTGPHEWNRGAPNGSIDVTSDVFSVSRQFGHVCPHAHGANTPFGPHPTAPTTAIPFSQTAPFAMSVGTTAGFAASGQLLVDDPMPYAETMTYNQNSGACPGFNPATQFCITARGATAQHGTSSVVYQKP
jgi:subtilisin family serine protease